MTEISIIIPVFNEQATISELLNYLKENCKSPQQAELIVVDGGSTDRTREIISDFILERDSESLSELAIQSNIFLIHSPKGRAKQMNHGARIAKGSIFYFLHADSFPPKDFDQLIKDEVKKGHRAGCFRMQFDHSHWWLRLAGWLTQFNWRACRGGDQSQFITRELFEAIGGYDERYIIYEDNILINDLYARGEFKVIQQTIKTSARLYEEYGIWRVQYHFWTIYVKRWFGASPNELFTYYKSVFK